MILNGCDTPTADTAGRAVVSLHPRSRTAAHDPRWPEIATALAALRDRKRRAVRIVDADCGAGCLLLEAMRHARALGFTAIEGRGIDASPALIGRARAAAARLRDPAIGVVFAAADLERALDEERHFPADIVLWHGTTTGSATGSATGAATGPATGAARRLEAALARAGDRVIGHGGADMLREKAA